MDAQPRLLYDTGCLTDFERKFRNSESSFFTDFLFKKSLSNSLTSSFSRKFGAMLNVFKKRLGRSPLTLCFAS